ncbi:flagellar protein FliT [Clostridium isatidis]|uniref:flagellar protein FliT n=1 Tax=Clostridium isatidis TaxID=182773 RepID=UPI003AB0A03D
MEEIFNNYKNITRAIILNLKNGLDVENLMNKREYIIKKIVESDFDKALLKEMYINKGIMKLDKELEEVIKEEQKSVRNELQSLYNRRKANNMYENNKKINSFFNRKI